MVQAYTSRLKQALEDLLSQQGVEVGVDQFMVTFSLGNMHTTTHLPSDDRRKPVTREAVDEVVRMAASRLAGLIPHYKPEFVAPAEDLVARLRKAVS